MKFKVGILAGLALGLASCAERLDSSNALSTGTIANVNGQVRVLNAVEEMSVCSTQKCEPNYTYYANFGRKRPSTNPVTPPPAPPVPIPTPVPTSSPSPDPMPTPPAKPIPSPTPIVGSVPAGDAINYAKNLMHVPSAWSYSTGSRDVVVAIVDTGVDVSHADLKDNIWKNSAEANGSPGVDDDGNGYIDDVYGWDFYNKRPNAIDDADHGTHCAGVIGAQLNNLGVAGISPLVKIMPLKFLGADGSGSTDAAVSAINYAVNNGAVVISNSWGGPGNSTFLNDAIQRAASFGVFVVAAAGNSAQNIDITPSYPASYANVITVAASDSNDALASYSNKGPNAVEVVAPGSEIYSTVRGGKWALMSGTSMAAPQVAGAIALGLSFGKNITNAQVEDALCVSSKKILTSYAKCGRMDVLDFINIIRSY